MKQDEDFLSKLKRLHAEGKEPLWNCSEIEGFLYDHAEAIIRLVEAAQELKMRNAAAISDGAGGTIPELEEVVRADYGELLDALAALEEK